MCVKERSHCGLLLVVSKILDVLILVEKISMRTKTSHVKDVYEEGEIREKSRLRNAYEE